MGDGCGAVMLETRDTDEQEERTLGGGSKLVLLLVITISASDHSGSRMHSVENISEIGLAVLKMRHW